MVRAMKPPIFVRSFSEKEREQLEAGLRSKDTFTLRRSQMLCGGCPTECTTARRAARKSCPSELGPQTHEERITDGRLHEPRRAGDADFSRARRRAFLRRISACLRKGRTPNHLACFEDVSNKVGAVGGIRRGRRTVRLADIVGSVSRCSEFDRSFFPLRESARTKWKHMDRAFHRGEELPPVSLYKIDEYDFVLDGNHRVSVYRYHGVEWIDADVTEFRAPLPKDRKDECCPIHRHPATGMKGAVRT